MELIILAGMGAVGYYLSVNDSSKPTTELSRLKSYDIPNGFDIYNQNRLFLTEEKIRDASENLYNKSQYPQKTNIVPNYYNRLSSLLNKSKFNADFRYDRVDSLYNTKEDLDDVYSNTEFGEKDINVTNDIYVKPYIDRNTPFLSDLYNKNNKRRMTEKYQNIADKDLLAVSEQISNNADSIRNILSEDVTGESGQCIRKKTPRDMQRSGELVGVTSDYKAILVDDEIAKYPNSSNLRELSEPPANYPSYLAQFESQKFDTCGLPGAPNDTYHSTNAHSQNTLKKDISYQGGWSQYDQNGPMSYGIVPDNQLTHDNMMPDVKKKGGYGTNDLHSEHVMDFKNELFTGNLKSTWNKKQEVRPFFTPVADLSYIYGTPVRPEEEDSRYIPSLYRQNEKLFDEVRVTPGLNLAYDEIGTQGYQDMYRALPKNVDQLRTMDKPKISYEARIIDGQKGTERPVQAPVISYRPDGYKITTEADLLPKTDVNEGPKTVDNFIMKDTDRSHQLIEYTGGAYTNEEAVGRNVPVHMREKYKYADKQNFKLPKPLQKFAKAETSFNPNVNSYDIQFNARTQTGPNTNIIGTGTVNGIQTYANLSDMAKTTIKEEEMTKQYNTGTLAPNTMRGTVQYVDVAKPTIKEMTAEQNLNPNAPSQATQQMVYFPDIAKTTIRESTNAPAAPSNYFQENQTYANPSDNARITLKETIAEIPQTLTQILPVGQYTRAPNLQDTARTTTKENTVQNQYQTFTTPINRQFGATNYQDVAKPTIKEFMTQIPLNTMTLPVNQSHGSTHFQDIAKNTTKETTVKTPWNTFTVPVDQSQGSTHLQDVAKNTIKETTVKTPWNTFTLPVNQQQRAPNNQDIAKTTTKETTVKTPWNTFTVPVNQQQRAPNNQDIARNTTKETTVQTPWNTFTVPVDQQQRAPNNQDIARGTTKETTVQTPWNTFTVPVDQQQRAPNPQDITRTTTKESTVQIPWQTVNTPVNQNQRAPNPQDIARTTIKETTVHIPYNTSVVPTASGYQVNSQDNAKTTAKETTVQIPYNNFVSNPANNQIKSNLQDIMKTTPKETTVQNPYNTFLVPVNQYLRQPDYQDLAKRTMKETTVQIPYNTNTECIDQQQGDANTFSRTPLRSTMKEGTSQIPYNNNVTSVEQEQGKSGGFNRLPLRTTIKEGTVVIPYNTNTAFVDRQQGQASSFNGVPLRATTKETTIYNDHINGPTHDTDAKGYGYIAEPAFAPNTNKQFTGQEVYIPPPEGDTKSRNYNDMYNSQIDDRKDILHWYRPPTASGVDLGPIKEQINVILKNDDNKMAGPNPGYSVNNNLDRLMTNASVWANDNVGSDFYIDPKTLKQLNDNPYNIPYYGTHHG